MNTPTPRTANNNKQTDDYICVDREHGLWKRKEPKEPNVNADRLALALSLETIQDLEAENAALRTDKERLDWLLQDNVVRFDTSYHDRAAIDAKMKEDAK